jgi:hypothetical protein
MQRFYTALFVTLCIIARLKALDWRMQNKVVPLLVQNFENVLYKLYKPGL